MISSSSLLNKIWTIPICLTIFGTLFLTDGSYVESTIIPKWIAFNLGSIACYIGFFLVNKRAYLKIDLLFICTLLFVGFILIFIRISPSLHHTTKTLNIISFLLFVITFKSISWKQQRFINIIIFSFCLLQACYGLTQYMGFTCSNSCYFTITGSYDNPAGFAASIIAGFVVGLSLSRKAKCYKLLLTFSLLIITLSIILSRSRTGIICLLVITYINLQKYLKKNIRYYLLLLLILLFFSLCFFWKMKSTSGRIFIWTNTMEIIKENPFFGNGPGTFTSKYMKKQSEYFFKHSDSKYILLADNINHPLNEFLLFATEFGLFGFIFLITFFCFMFSVGKNKYSIYIISMALFSCFSYPLHYPFVVLMISYSIANISYPQRSKKARFGKKTKIASMPIIGILLYFIANDIKFQYRWGISSQMATFGITNNILDNYSNLLNEWNGDPLFLYNYAAIMNRIGKYEISNNILKVCSKNLIDYDTEMTMADNFEKEGDYKNAIRCFNTARYMCPNRFVPLYRLMINYHNSGEQEKAISIAKKIITKPIKKNSNIVSQIQLAARIYLKNKTLTY